MSKIIQDDVLGTLTYDPQWKWFSGVVPFGDTRVEISISFGSQSDPVSQADIAQAREAYLSLVARKADIEADIVRGLLDIYNDEWQEGDPISPDQFLDTIEPEDIEIVFGQVKTLGYKDGDLFAGHWVEVRFKDDGNISEIGLTG
jgi:hypothetical protein